MAAHSSIVAWEIPWTEEPGGLQSMGPRLRHDLATQPHLCYSTHEDNHICLCVCASVSMCVYVCVLSPI